MIWFGQLLYHIMLYLSDPTHPRWNRPSDSHERTVERRNRRVVSHRRTQERVAAEARIGPVPLSLASPDPQSTSRPLSTVGTDTVVPLLSIVVPKLEFAQSRSSTPPLSSSISLSSLASHLPASTRLVSASATSTAAEHVLRLPPPLSDRPRGPLVFDPVRVFQHLRLSSTPRHIPVPQPCPPPLLTPRPFFTRTLTPALYYAPAPQRSPTPPDIVPHFDPDLLAILPPPRPRRLFHTDGSPFHVPHPDHERPSTLQDVVRFTNWKRQPSPSRFYNSPSSPVIPRPEAPRHTYKRRLEDDDLDYYIPDKATRRTAILYRHSCQDPEPDYYTRFTNHNDPFDVLPPEFPQIASQQASRDLNHTGFRRIPHNGNGRDSTAILDPRVRLHRPPTPPPSSPDRLPYSETHMFPYHWRKKHPDLDGPYEESEPILRSIDRPPQLPLYPDDLPNLELIATLDDFYNSVPPATHARSAPDDLQGFFGTPAALLPNPIASSTLAVHIADLYTSYFSVGRPALFDFLFLHLRFDIFRSAVVLFHDPPELCAFLRLQLCVADQDEIMFWAPHPHSVIVHNSHPF